MCSVENDSPDFLFHQHYSGVMASWDFSSQRYLSFALPLYLSYKSNTNVVNIGSILTSAKKAPFFEKHATVLWPKCFYSALHISDYGIILHTSTEVAQLDNLRGKKAFGCTAIFKWRLPRPPARMRRGKKVPGCG